MATRGSSIYGTNQGNIEAGKGTGTYLDIRFPFSTIALSDFLAEYNSLIRKL
jgi:hypothetical protein